MYMCFVCSMYVHQGVALISNATKNVNDYVYFGHCLLVLCEFLQEQNVNAWIQVVIHLVHILTKHKHRQALK